MILIIVIHENRQSTKTTNKIFFFLLIIDFQYNYNKYIPTIPIVFIFRRRGLLTYL